MSFRLNPFKILRFVGIIAVLSYAYVELSEFKSQQKKTTESAAKDIKVRDKNFVETDKVKNDIAANQQNNAQTTGNTEGTANTTTTEGTATENQNAGATTDTTTATTDTKKADDTKKNATTAEDKKRKELEAQKQAAKQKELEQQRLQVQKAAEEKKRKEQEEAIKKAQREAQLKKQQQQQQQQAQAKAQQQAQAAKATTGGKKYIQVATLSSEAAAKSAVSRLGGNFSYRKSGNNYVVVSKTVNTEQELNALKNQINSRIPGTKFAVRTVGN